MKLCNLQRMNWVSRMIEKNRETEDRRPAQI
jgi:hypothetical protein